MEATGCRLAMTGHSTLVIVSVYLPSPKRLLRRDLRALFALGDAVILFGDFNCKYHSHDIASTDEIDFAIGALTNHVRTVVEESEREIPASSDRRKFPPDILQLIRAKTQLCAARAHIPLPSTDRLTLLQRQLKALMTSTTRMTDLEREGNRPVTVSCDILCRNDFLQASSIAHVTRRRHSHVPSGTRGFQSHTTHAYGREGVQDRHFLPPPRRKRETKKTNVKKMTKWSRIWTPVPASVSARFSTSDILPERIIGPGSYSERMRSTANS
ncbi:hypothetical protein EVAR_89290_1 [Eumeta japonica]|uniref:RNA-directed DNA polymerase from mobile element jockey n=1 Tax=Eumeta variegata TaxID=151549 RepID=A0A4C1YTN9_EUMVA|nr:hypothetical protein EVAR_89290_1 [Eumeta japonica]